MRDDADPAAFDARVEELTRALDGSPDADARRCARELVRLVLEFHGLGLRRLLDIAGEDMTLRERMATDPVLAALFALHEIAPERGPSGTGLGVPADGPRLLRIGRRFDAPGGAATLAHGDEPSCCDRCGEPVGDSHHHFVDVVSRRLSCSCRACWLLSAAHPAQGSLRAVPDRYIAGSSFRLTEAQWDALEIPVATAFFMFNSTAGRTIAFYPSPAGATESALSLAAWHDVEHANPWVRAALPDVEAVLVRKNQDAPGYDAFIVPIDACYRLAGRIRICWSGFSGGGEVRREIDRVFQDAAARSTSSAASGGTRP